MKMNRWMSKVTVTKNTNGPDNDVSGPARCQKEVSEVLKFVIFIHSILTSTYFVSINPRQGVGMHICKAGDEETEDVVVDGDDTAAFGQPQFNEHDIQTAAADHSSQEEGKPNQDTHFFSFGIQIICIK